MKIEVDKQGEQVVINLIDAALKLGGIQAFNNASTALTAMGVATIPKKRKRQPIKK